tara:strand:- start:894 stop:1025 length:132 start_codon:yes stop_codon:yes gene_type:complete
MTIDTDLHKKKKKSNYIILTMVVGWSAVIFLIAVIKMMSSIPA